MVDFIAFIDRSQYYHLAFQPQQLGWQGTYGPYSPLPTSQLVRPAARWREDHLRDSQMVASRVILQATSFFIGLTAGFHKLL